MAVVKIRLFSYLLQVNIVFRRYKKTWISDALSPTLRHVTLAPCIPSSQHALRVREAWPHNFEARNHVFFSSFAIFLVVFSFGINDILFCFVKFISSIYNCEVVED